MKETINIRFLYCFKSERWSKWCDRRAVNVILGHRSISRNRSTAKTTFYIAGRLIDVIDTLFIIVSAFIKAPPGASLWLSGGHWSTFRPRPTHGPTFSLRSHNSHTLWPISVIQKLLERPWDGLRLSFLKKSSRTMVKGVATPQIVFYAFLCAQITRKWCARFWLFKNSWKAFWTD